MCIGLPLQVQSVEAGHAWVVGHGERRRVNTALVDADRPCQPGDWLLVFLDGARERLSPERAAEIDATLDLLGDALAGLQPHAPAGAAFALPSAMSAEQLAALTGSPPSPNATTRKETT
jgi:hydrogenase expression/formation protein HypC